MNETQARILILGDQLRTDLRYAEYISEKLDMSYPGIARYLREMKHKGWVRFTRTKRKFVITSVSMEKLEEAKKVLENVG